MPAKIQIKGDGRNHNTQIIVNGCDISSNVRGMTITYGPAALPTVTVELVGPLEVEDEFWAYFAIKLDEDK